MAEATLHFGKIDGNGMPLWPTAAWFCPSAIVEVMVHIHQTQANEHKHILAHYWIFVWAGLYQMAMPNDQRPVLRSTGIATYLFLW